MEKFEYGGHNLSPRSDVPSAMEVFRRKGEAQSSGKPSNQSDLLKNSYPVEYATWRPTAKAMKQIGNNRK